MISFFHELSLKKSLILPAKLGLIVENKMNGSPLSKIINVIFDIYSPMDVVIPSLIPVPKTE